MKKICLVLFLAAAVTLYCEMITRTGTYEMRFGEDKSIRDAKDECKKMAVKNGLENFAMFISSETVVKDFELEKDVIVAKVEADVTDVVEKFDLDPLNFNIKCDVTFNIDKDKVLKKLQELSEELKKKGSGSIDAIKFSGEYFYGEGANASKEDAENEATAKLVENIAAELKDDYAEIADGEDLFKFAVSNIMTYKTEFNSLFERKIDGDTVLKFIRKEDLSKMFRLRYRTILEYIQMAVAKESELALGDALKHYYWALSLLRSHPDYKSIVYSDDRCSNEFNGKLLSLALPDKIKSLLKGVDFHVTKIKPETDSKTVYVTALYKGVEIPELDYKYFTGNDDSQLQAIRNGRGSCEFYGEYAKNLSELRIDVEYIYKRESSINKSLENVINGLTGARFGYECRKRVPLEENFPIPQPVKTPEIKVSNLVQNIVSPAVKTGSIAGQMPKFEPSKKKEYQKLELTEDQIGKCHSAVAEIVKAILNNDYSGIDPLFTQEGLETFNRIIKYGDAKLMSDTFDLETYRVNDDIMVRSIPMKFSHKTNSRSIIEDVILVFNKDLMIDHLSFALSKTAINDIMSKDDRFATAAEKLQIVSFMEYYKTAYCLKQLDYINSLFAENALIIIGKILKEDPMTDISKHQAAVKDKVKYTKLSKSEYVEQLRHVFRSNEYVNIKFDSSEIRKVGGDSRIYGIQIKQNYYSTNYADEGYLFLMMDLGDPKNPRIYVRSWQPEKNADGSIIGLNDFSF
jgi:hypothetical protein